LRICGKPNKALALIPDHCGHTPILGHKRQNESYPQVVDKFRLKKVTKKLPKGTLYGCHLYGQVLSLSH
jgi:hypothetical protein